MIRRIKYNIRFPLGANFQKDPEIILLKKIYQEICSCCCISDKDCLNCTKEFKCIYYLLSGENFEQYPSITINRNLANKRSYGPKETFQVTFNLIGVAMNYSEFITTFMDSDEYLAGNFYQKVLVENTIIDEEKCYSGIIKYQNVVTDTLDIISSIKYFNETYKTSFKLPTFKNVGSSLDFKDKTQYIINNKKIKISGKIFQAEVIDYPIILIDIGVGKYAYIGGGIVKCVSE